MIITFALDTSASMNQRAANGMSLLDIAKSAIEFFLKIRGRDPQAIRTDRFLLVTFEDGPGGVRCGWKEPFSIFMEQVKNATAKDHTQTSIDNYGQGRNPWFLEPAAVILLTDGGLFSSSSGITDTLTLSSAFALGQELTMEPFRWDQRLFTIALQIPGFNNPDLPPVSDGPQMLSLMSEVTGGRCQAVSSMKALFGVIEGIISRLQPGVVVSFETVLPLPASAPVIAPSLHKLLYVRTTQPGSWPIPEAFLPDPALTQLPPRNAQPTIKFLPVDSDPYIVENFPFDKYELEPCALSSALLAHKHGVCWPVYVPGSAGGGANNLGEPFGYLKVSSAAATVNLVVLPYNYPGLWSLLDELASPTLKMIPSPRWRQEFERYLGTVPPYYLPYLRTALKRWGAPTNLIPEHIDGGLSYAIANYLKKLKVQSKMDTDRIATTAVAKATAGKDTTTFAMPQVNRPVPRASSPRRGALGSDVEALDAMELTPAPVVETDANVTAYRNAFDLSRDGLLNHIERLRVHIFAQPGARHDDEEAKHNIPVSIMGNYQETVKRRGDLREINEDDERRARMPMFGNPFVTPEKIAQRLSAAAGALIDESEDEGSMSNAMRNSPKQQGGKRSRSPSPILRLGARRPKPPPAAAGGSPLLGSAPSSPAPSSPRPGSPMPAVRDINPKHAASIANLTPSVPSSALGDANIGVPPDVDLERRPPHHQHPAALPVVPSAAPPRAPSPVSTPPSSAPSSPLLTTPPLSPAPAPDPKLRTGPPAPAPGPKGAPLADAELRNQILKELKKPGKNYQDLFKMLAQIKGIALHYLITDLAGSLADRRAFIVELKSHAQRFKKQTLIEELEKHEKTITE